jgi:hypothetical protein
VELFSSSDRTTSPAVLAVLAQRVNELEQGQNTHKGATASKAEAVALGQAVDRVSARVEEMAERTQELSRRKVITATELELEVNKMRVWVMEDLMGKGASSGTRAPSVADGMLRRDQLKEYVEGAVADTLGGQLTTMQTRLTHIAARLEGGGDGGDAAQEGIEERLGEKFDKMLQQFGTELGEESANWVNRTEFNKLLNGLRRGHQLHQQQLNDSQRSQQSPGSTVRPDLAPPTPATPTAPQRGERGERGERGAQGESQSYIPMTPMTPGTPGPVDPRMLQQAQQDAVMRMCVCVCVCVWTTNGLTTLMQAHGG